MVFFKAGELRRSEVTQAFFEEETARAMREYAASVAKPLVGTVAAMPTPVVSLPGWAQYFTEARSFHDLEDRVGPEALDRLKTHGPEL